MSRSPTPSARRAMPSREQHLHQLTSVLNTIPSEKISSPRPSGFQQLSCYAASQPLNFPPRTSLSLLHFPTAWPSERSCHNVFSTPRNPGGFRLSGCAEFTSAELRQAGVKSTVTEQKGDRMCAKWSDAQANVLVQEWKERIEEVESRRNSEAWQKIVQEVNKTGTLKSIKQCKDKLRNMKQAYKDAKSSNMIETGCTPKRSPFYEEFDEILGSRPVAVPAPEVIQAGVNTSAKSSAGSTTSQELAANSDSGGESDADDSSYGTSEKRRRCEKTPVKKRVKMTQPKSSTVEYALKDIAEKILEMQSVQVNALERSQARTEDLILKLDAEQRRYDEQARCRDQDFFLRLADILKK